MLTFGQIAIRKKRKTRGFKRKRAGLDLCPQRKGVCMKVHIMTPKKPCSARRAITRVKITNKKMVTCHIPGVDHNIKKFSTVIVRVGRPNDIPGVQYKVIRGARKTDLQPVYKRTSSRSRYGVKNPQRLHRLRYTRGKGDKIYQQFS